MVSPPPQACTHTTPKPGNTYSFSLTRTRTHTHKDTLSNTRTHTNPSTRMHAGHTMIWAPSSSPWVKNMFCCPKELALNMHGREVIFRREGSCGISVWHTKHTNDSLLAALGVHVLERKGDTMWIWSTYICFDGHKWFGEKESKTQGVFLRLHSAVLLLTVSILESTLSPQKYFLWTYVFHDTIIYLLG